MIFKPKNKTKRLAVGLVASLLASALAAQDEGDVVPIPYIQQTNQEEVKPGEPVVAITYQIKWKSIEKAIKEASVDHKPVLVLVGADFCFGCRQVEKNLNNLAADDRFEGWHLTKVDYAKDRDEAVGLMGDVPLLPQLILSQWSGKEWKHRKLVGSPSPAELKAWLGRPIGKDFSIK